MCVCVGGGGGGEGRGLLKFEIFIVQSGSCTFPTI